MIDQVADARLRYLAYFVGQSEIASLRARAERQLGARFDIRLFHDDLLRNGPLPFDVLEAQISDWMRREGESIVVMRHNPDRSTTAPSFIEVFG